MIDLMKLRFMAGRSLKSQGMYVFSGELVLPPLQFAAPQSAAHQRAFPGSLSGGGYRKQASRGSECSSGSETDSTNTVTARQPLNIDIIAGARPGSHHDRFLSHLQAMAAVDSDLFVRSTCDFRKTTRQLALKFRAKMAFSTAENNPPAVGQHCPSPWTRRDETVSNGATNEARGVRIHQCVDDRE